MAGTSPPVSLCRAFWGGRCSCHTKRWYNQSRCSQWCSCNSCWGSKGQWQIVSTSQRRRGVAVPYSRLLVSEGLVKSSWCGHRGTWSSWPSPLWPCGWGCAPSSSFCVIEPLDLFLAWRQTSRDGETADQYESTAPIPSEAACRLQTAAPSYEGTIKNI
jgi:hypothetical protein